MLAWPGHKYEVLQLLYGSCGQYYYIDVTLELKYIIETNLVRVTIIVQAITFALTVILKQLHIITRWSASDI